MTDKYEPFIEYEIVPSKMILLSKRDLSRVSSVKWKSPRRTVFKYITYLDNKSISLGRFILQDELKNTKFKSPVVIMKNNVIPDFRRENLMICKRSKFRFSGSWAY